MALVCSVLSSLVTSRLTPAARLSGPGVTVKIGEVILLQVLSELPALEVSARQASARLRSFQLEQREQPTTPFVPAPG